MNQESTDASKTFQPDLCSYCGNSILKDQEVCTKKKRRFHKYCLSVHIPRIQGAVEEFKKLYSINPHVLWLGIHVSYVYGQKKKDKNNKIKRSLKIKELLKLVSALRNSNSGHILIHLVGLAPGDTFTGSFDEFADVKLLGLINDGSSFTDVYQKQLLSSKKHLEDYTDILSLFVKGSDILASSDLNTKSALDDCIIDTPDLNFLKLVRKRTQFEKDNYHQIGSVPGGIPTSLQESRNIQTKACFNPPDSDAKLACSILDNLKLAEYVSAFTKHEDGGSFLFGINEQEQEYKEQGYVSRTFLVDPVVIINLHEQLIQKTILVCDYDGVKRSNRDVIQVHFIPPSSINLSKTDREGFVIQVSVRSVSGIVFYDKGGPLAYRVEDQTGDIVRLTLQQWFQVFKQRLEAETEGH